MFFNFYLPYLIDGGGVGSILIAFITNILIIGTWLRLVFKTKLLPLSKLMIAIIFIELLLFFASEGMRAQLFHEGIKVSILTSLLLGIVDGGSKFLLSLKLLNLDAKKSLPFLLYLVSIAILGILLFNYFSHWCSPPYLCLCKC